MVKNIGSLSAVGQEITKKKCCWENVDATNPSDKAIWYRGHVDNALALIEQTSVRRMLR